MSARTIGSGVVSFGLVSIPIRLYSTNQSGSGISFNMLHKKCKSRLKQQYICPKDNNEVVPRDEMVKGYEFAKDQYVVFTEEELKAVEEAASKTIEISEFVPASQIDPVYFEGGFYLGPDKGGDKPFRLLREAMKQTGRVALAKYAARGKQYLVMVRPIENGLMMHELRYADEVKPYSEVPVPEADIKEGELKLAIQLVEQIANDKFEPKNYEDGVKKRLQEIIQRKVEGQDVTAAPTEAPKAQIIDLMEALKASLVQKAEPGANGATADEARKPPKRSPRGIQPATEKKASKSAKG
jgi:DNA end-binding protein Ku